jgi:hypothetical protein
VHLYSLSRRTYPYILFIFFPYTYNCVVIDSLAEDGYREASNYGGRLDPGDA